MIGQMDAWVALHGAVWGIRSSSNDWRGLKQDFV
jgi:hypothetical protein